MRLPQGAEWLILLLIVVLLFGAKRLPDAARGLGRSLRIFKAETKALADDDSAPAPVAASAPPQAVPAAEPAPVATPPAPAVATETPAAAPAAPVVEKPADQTHA